MKEPVNMKLVNEITKEIVTELLRAAEKFPGFNSTHEGMGVIEEEYLELWDFVKANKDPYNPTPNIKEMMVKEAIQLGAMAVKFVMFLMENKEETKTSTKTFMQEIFGEEHCKDCPDLKKCIDKG